MNEADSINPRKSIAVFLIPLVYAALLTGMFFTSYSALIMKDWAREDYNYCYLIPLIAIYLVWEKRKEFFKRQSSPSWWGFSLVVPGILFFWVGELAGESYSLYLSSWLVATGLLWIHLGWEKIKTLSFPILLLLTMFPLPYFINNNITLNLKLISSQLGVFMIQLYGMTAYREGNVIDLGGKQLQVVDACSGLRYLFPLLILGIIMAYFYRVRMWKRVLIVLSTIPLAILMNSLRIALTGIICGYMGLAAAEGFFHGFSGWLIFMLCLSLLVVEMWVLNRAFPEKKENVKLLNTAVEPETADAGQNGAMPESTEQGLKDGWRWKRFTIAAVLLGLSFAAVNTIEFRGKIPLKKSFAQFPLQVAEWKGVRKTMDREFLEQLDLSDYILVDYYNASGKPLNFYVAYYESQRKGESVHSPESCLPGSGWVFRQGGTVSIRLQSGKSMVVNRTIMEKNGKRQVLYFWFPARGRILTNFYELKLFGFWDAVTRHRTDAALVRVFTPLQNLEKIEAADERLKSFVVMIDPVLNKFLPDK